MRGIVVRRRGVGMCQLVATYVGMNSYRFGIDFAARAG